MDYELQFSSNTMLEFNEKLIPTGQVVHDPAFTVAAPLAAAVSIIVSCLKYRKEQPCCLLRNPQNGVTLTIYTNSLYPYLQIYTPDHRNSIAIENLSGAPDCFQQRNGPAFTRSPTYCHI